MEDKDLDKLFQDKFEGIEAPPDPQVWDRIASSLDEKKKKKRVVPFWWLSAGAAAVLLLSLWLGGVFSSEPQGPALPEIVNEDLKEDPTPEDQRSITQEQEIQETTPLAEEQKQEDLPVNSAPKIDVWMDDWRLAIHVTAAEPTKEINPIINLPVVLS